MLPSLTAFVGQTEVKAMLSPFAQISGWRIFKQMADQIGGRGWPVHCLRLEPRSPAFAMTLDATPASPFDFVQTDAGLGVLRMASLLAESDGEPDEEALDLMFEQVEAGLLNDLAPEPLWAELSRGLMGAAPAKMLLALRGCGALSLVLPEVAALFGVPQISEDDIGVDLGEHVLNSLTEAARCDAPLPVRFALLAMNVGKSDSPKEHLPVHYKHIDRGRPRIVAMAARLGAPLECVELALLAIAECERVHRASKVRAGPIAAMLDRIGAFSEPERFVQLMNVCACDFRAYGGRSGQVYAKAELLEQALAACAQSDAESPPDNEEARAVGHAQAIARAFKSQRWSGEEDA
jgi:tRNA nucleotidyltransferase (CCA-adding enzyme)